MAYWAAGATKRVFIVTPGYQMLSIDATTGALDPAFGVKGVLDMRTHLGYTVEDLDKAEIGLHSAPIVANGIVIVGSAHLPGGAPPTKEHIKGVVMGFDVRTGKKLWGFNAIPGHGEKGNDTWLNDSWTYTGNTGSWAPDVGRRRAGPRLRARRGADRRLLRRSPARRQSVPSRSSPST